MVDRISTRTTVAEPVFEPEESLEGIGLLVVSAEAVVSYPLPASGSVLIGRSTECDVQLEDGLASRKHARVHVGTGWLLEIEDLGSANGTRVRGERVPAGGRVPVLLGESVSLGATVLVVQPVRQAGGVRRIWAHRWFEDRLHEECERGDLERTRFALLRLRLAHPAPWPRMVALLDRCLAPPHVFAAYGPSDYEVLVFARDDSELAAVVEPLRRSLSAHGLSFRQSAAFYPRDGRTGDALMGRANALLRPDGLGAALPLAVNLAPGMQKVQTLAERAARGSINVLIVGETGVGKEVLAQSLHRLSARAGQPMVALNCAGISETLIESELFGHERGAFTGAVQAKKGLFEAAEGGTLFLDEVGEMPLAVQAKVLRAIANREIIPVGSVKPRPIDVRIIAATNLDLDQRIAAGHFREDLYYRLNGITLPIPPLRERQSEILALAHLFLDQAARDMGRSVPSLSIAAADLLTGYAWPGNIRELKNIVERAVVLCEGERIDLDHLPVEKMRPTPPGTGGQVVQASQRTPSTTIGPSFSAEEVTERQRLLEALEANIWNQSRAAKSLNMSRRAFLSKLDRYGIPRPQKASGPPGPNDEDD